MNNFNFKPFASTYIKVQIPLDDKVLTAFEQSAEYACLVDDLHNAYKNKSCNGVYCTLNIGFNLESNETDFEIETHCTYINGDTDSGTTYADFDPITANYFRAEAMRHILNNFSGMAKCKPMQTVISA